MSPEHLNAPDTLSPMAQARSDFDALTWVWLNEPNMGQPAELNKTLRQLAWIACCAFEANRARPAWQQYGIRFAIVERLAMAAHKIAGPESSSVKSRTALNHEIQTEWMCDADDLRDFATAALFEQTSPFPKPKECTADWAPPSHRSPEWPALMGELASRLDEATRSPGLFNASLGMAIALRGAILLAIPAWLAASDRRELDALCPMPAAKPRMTL